jgi:prepilin signal peptidase PulO-like enzyme (type II secretory pathway)
MLMELVIYVALVLVGACMGSFAGATTWRLRAFQLKADKKAGEKVDQAEYKRLEPLTKAKLSTDRSRCLHCGYTLQWYDLVPIVSWLSLKGKCRNCRTPIGYFELVIELGMVAFFVLSYAFWPAALDSWQTITHFALWLVAGVGLGILFAYDAKWFLLPDRVNFIVIGVGALVAILSIVTASDPLTQLWSVLGSVAILSGLYLILYVASRQRWIGFGDVKLGLGLGLLLADWRLALIGLFAANLIGSLAVIPGLMSGKLKGQSHVPFGPLLILGTVVAQLAGMLIVNYYLSTLLFY